jgi:hypothetical protein
MKVKQAHLVLLGVLLQVTLCLANGDAVTSGLSNIDTYFPLVVGNEWEYDCSVEGEHAFYKTLNITAAENSNGSKIYRGELQMDDSSDILVLYYTTDLYGAVYSSLDKNKKSRVKITPPNRQDVAGINGLFVRKGKEVELPGLGNVAAILIENFELEDQKLSESMRMEWEGKYYVRGIGLVMEADGLGGECVLQKFISIDEKRKSPE